MFNSKIVPHQVNYLLNVSSCKNYFLSLVQYFLSLVHSCIVSPKPKKFYGRAKDSAGKSGRIRTDNELTLEKFSDI